VSNVDIAKNIDKHGWHFVHVIDPNSEKPDFSHTIGLEQKYKHPEIIIFGLNKDSAHAIFTDIVADIKCRSNARTKHGIEWAGRRGF